MPLALPAATKLTEHWYDDGAWLHLRTNSSDLANRRRGP
jgi:hypothetical protein